MLEAVFGWFGKSEADSPTPKTPPDADFTIVHSNADIDRVIARAMKTMENELIFLPEPIQRPGSNRPLAAGEWWIEPGNEVKWDRKGLRTEPGYHFMRGHIPPRRKTLALREHLAKTWDFSKGPPPSDERPDW